MAITSAQQTDIIKYTVGLFGAAPGGYMSGFAEYVDSGASMQDFVNVMVSTDVFKSASFYPSYLTAAQFADRFVDNFLGTEVSSDMLTAAKDWVEAQLNGGATIGEVVYQAIVAVDGVTEDNTDWYGAKQALDNKVEVATYYTIEKAGDASDLSTLMGAVSAVTSSSDSVDTAKSAIDGGGSGVGGGQTFTLTKSGTTGSFDNTTGTSGDDIFVAGPATAETGDVLAGGAGTDALKIQEDNSGRTMAPTLSAIEQVWLNNAGTTAATETFSGANASGITEVWADRIQDTGAGSGGDAAVAFTNISKSVQLGVYGGTSTAANRTDVTFTLSDVSGSADEATLVLDEAAVRNVTIAGVETLNIKTQGGANKIDGTLTAAAATKVVFTGDQDAVIDDTDLGTTDTEIDASAMTGGLTIQLEDAAIKETFKGGSGNDHLITVGTNFAAGDSFDGGDGDADVIGIATKDKITAATGKLIKNFEIFDAAGASGAAANDYDMDLITGDGTSSTITGLLVSAALGGATQITNLAKGADVTIKATPGEALTVVQKGADGAGSNSDVLNYELTGNADITVASLVAANVETINIASTATDGKTTGHTLAASTFANATTVKITGDEKFTATTLGAAAATHIDASEMTDKFIMTNASTAATILLLEGGTKDDTLGIDDDTQLANSVVQGNGGSDTIDLATDSVDDGDGGVVSIVKFVAQSDSSVSGGWDKISNFDDVGEDDVGEDLIDLVAFGFTGTAIGALLDKSTTVTNTTTGASADFTIADSAAANFFNDAGVDRAVAFDDNGSDTFFFVDVNGDGDWSEADDMVFLLVGNSNTLDTADFTFA